MYFATFIRHSTRSRICRALASILFFCSALEFAAGVRAEHATLQGPSITAIDPAILERIPLPHLSGGWVPQGLAVFSRHVYLVGYTGGLDWGSHRCMLFDFDVMSRKFRGPVLIDEACRHGGGLAVIPGGQLLVADLDWLFVVRPDKFDWTNHDEYQPVALQKKIKVAGDLRGGLTAGSSREGLWMTRYSKKGAERLDLFEWRRIVDTEVAVLQRDMAIKSIPGPAEAQGLAVDPSGNVWVSTSTGDRAAFYVIDPTASMAPRRIPAVGGIEDIDFDEDHQLWATSEAGVSQWAMSTFYPFLFKVDVRKLFSFPNL